MECCTSSAGKRFRCTFFCCARNCSASSDLLTVWVTIRERYSCTAETYILTNGVVFDPINTTGRQWGGLGELAQCRYLRQASRAWDAAFRQTLGGFFAKDSGHVVEGLWNSKGVHFARAIEARLD